MWCGLHGVRKEVIVHDDAVQAGLCTTKIREEAKTGHTHNTQRPEVGNLTETVSELKI